ncbi:hypothetical protein EMIHUDRAFT_245832 [Emiliania huxleyi CCMP1516]|uniref:Formamidase n=2 Tax=Emiliania huxleyi TaxID=2903 RepID=A0A0D3IW47_EMIH1|nr:hypothetical protein EMIHUDRAFT_245832 [Emiliania huxleyi CCMP1516]EOD15482.1 hypothetical protein EMIHUDRAFT_245832 [Emiliania huxleyi CCMP1516]|eukprot:XP_005767911.1 hypothetical protein EMIHUDRAFT_245832 [Emiliania huxleyi CCMP1516]
MSRLALLAIPAAVAFSSTPESMVTVKGITTDCDGSQCFNRLHPSIPMAAMAEPDQATSDYKNTSCTSCNFDFERNTKHIRTLHQLAGPVGIAGAVAGDKIAITILDIEAKTQGWNHAAPNLGMLSDMVTAGTFNWWMPKGPNPAKPDCWVSELFPDVEIPYNPFPGIVTVLPNMEIVQREREITVLEAGGTAQPAGSGTMGLTGDMPSERHVCGEGGSDPENCLRTIAPDRITVGNTLVIECFVDGCGIGIGDVHGAQGDGEVSITAIEMEALVKVKVKLIKPDDPMYHLPSPTTLGASLNPLHSSPFVSFHGFGDKPEPIPDFAGEANFPWPIQQHITFGEVMNNMTFVADNLQMSGRNALIKCIKFLHDVLDYSFNQGLILASVAVDLRVAQVVDKPQASMEAYLPLDIFTGEAKAKMMAAVGM